MRVEQRGQVYFAGCEQIAHVAGGADMVCGRERSWAWSYLLVSQILISGRCLDPRWRVSAEMKVISGQTILPLLPFTSSSSMDNHDISDEESERAECEYEIGPRIQKLTFLSVQRRIPDYIKLHQSVNVRPSSSPYYLA